MLLNLLKTNPLSKYKQIIMTLPLIRQSFNRTKPKIMQSSPDSGIDWSMKYPQVLQQIRSQMKNSANRQPFAKNYGQEVVSYIVKLFEQQKWKQILNFIEEWNLWEHIAKSIDAKLGGRKCKLVSNDVQSLRDLAKVLYRLGYQTSPNNKVILQAVKPNVLPPDTFEKMLVFLPLLNCDRQLMTEYREFMQNILMQKLKLKQINDLMSLVVQFGIFQKFWSPSFLENFCKTMRQMKSELPQKIYTKLNNLFLLMDPTSQQKVEKAPQKQGYIRSKSQTKIGLMLKDLGYIVKQNILIFNFQFDFVLGNKIIIQFNGVSHYKINNQPVKTKAQSHQKRSTRSSRSQPQPELQLDYSKFGLVKRNIEELKYQKWRNQMLVNRGYTVICIPFYEWEQMAGGERQQKQYLIEKIQKGIINQIRNAAI